VESGIPSTEKPAQPQASTSSGTILLLALACLAHAVLALRIPQAFALASERPARAVIDHSPTLIWLIAAVSIAAIGGVTVIGFFVARRPKVRRIALALPALSVVAVAQAAYLSLGTNAGQTPWQIRAVDVFGIGALAAAVTASAAAITIGLSKGDVRYNSAFWRTLALGTAVAVLVAAFAHERAGVASWLSMVPALAGVFGVACLSGSVEAAAQESRHSAAARAGGDMLIASTLALVAVAFAAFGGGAARLSGSLAAAVAEPADVLSLAVRTTLANAWAQSLAVAVASMVGFVPRARWIGMSVSMRRGELLVAALVALVVVVGARVQMPSTALADDLGDSRSMPTSALSDVRAVPETAHAAQVEPLEEPPTAAPEVVDAAPSEAATAGLARFRVRHAQGIMDRDVQTGLQRRQTWFAGCATKHAKEPATIDITFLIDGSGGVAQITDKGPPEAPDELVRCTLLMLYRVGFARPHLERASVALSIDYSPGG
jgi:hypothetical protein